MLSVKENPNTKRVTLVQRPVVTAQNLREQNKKITGDCEEKKERGYCRI